MADIIELYGISVPVDLRTEEIIYPEVPILYGTQSPTDLRADETIYPDPLGLYGIQTPTDPHIHFFGSEVLTEVAGGANFRDVGERVSFPYPIFATATGLSQDTKLTFQEVAALASNARIQVRYATGDPAAIVGIVIDGEYFLDCI